MTDLKARIIARVTPDLLHIEKALNDHLGPKTQLVEKVAGHLLFAGGKRLRPLLMVLGARLCGYHDDNIFSYAVMGEYLHAATLLHDDLIDGGELRRGKPAAHKVFGPEIAVLTGDFLLARAIRMAVRTAKIEVVRTITGITEAMSIGEIDQLDRIGDADLTEDAYMEIIRRKTAILFEGTCRCGALIAEAPANQMEALTTYGYHLGMAFQITDDLLDYTAGSATLGKKAGADLREGKLTLPLIRALKLAVPNDRKTMLAVIHNPDFSLADLERLVKIMERLGTLESAGQTAQNHVQQANTALAVFPSGTLKALLTDIAEYALIRKL